MKTNKLLIILLLGIAFALTACSTNDSKDKNPVPNTPTEEKDKDKEETEDSETNDKAEINEIKAFEMFADKYPNATIKKVELDEDRGVYYYKVKGYENNVRYEMKFNQVDGEVIKDDQETKDTVDEYISITAADLDKVKSIVDKAMSDAGADAILNEWTLDTENNRLEVEVEIDLKDGSDSEITYDLETGDVVEIDD